MIGQVTRFHTKAITNICGIYYVLPYLVLADTHLHLKLATSSLSLPLFFLGILLFFFFRTERRKLEPECQSLTKYEILDPTIDI